MDGTCTQRGSLKEKKEKCIWHQNERFEFFATKEWVKNAMWNMALTGYTKSKRERKEILPN